MSLPLESRLIMLHIEGPGRLWKKEEKEEKKEEEEKEQKELTAKVYF